MAGITLDENQKAALSSFKEFVVNAQTKLGFAIDKESLQYQIDKAGTILCKGVVKDVPVTQQAQGLNILKPVTEGPKTQDVTVFWDMNGNCVQNHTFSLVQVIIPE